MISVATLSDQEHFVNVLEHGAVPFEELVGRHFLEWVALLENMSICLIHHRVSPLSTSLVMMHSHDLKTVYCSIMYSGEGW